MPMAVMTMLIHMLIAFDLLQLNNYALDITELEKILVLILNAASMQL